MEIYSPSATVPNAQLLGLEDLPLGKCLDQQSAHKLQNRVAAFFREKAQIDFQLDFDSSEKIDEQLGRGVWMLFKHRHNINFVRTIATDARLADLLLDELLNRGLFKKGTNDSVVFISEWDTFYGRTQPEIFHQVIRQRDDQCPVQGVYKYSYLRGLDGRTPGSKESKDSRLGSGGGKEDKEKEQLFLEEPVGPSQYDYLRRLADKIYNHHRELRKQGKGPIRAVGILGNDFYDKYLVLQALKQRLPEAIYFTTDLDARYLHESYNKDTCNLVVAAGFDLELTEEIQGNVPPFRTSYQTSVFYAVLKAFCGNMPSKQNDPVLTSFCQKNQRLGSQSTPDF